MHAFVRAGVIAALSLAFAISSAVTATSADKPYAREDLADAAIRLQAEIKSDAGTVTKPVDCGMVTSDSAEVVWLMVPVGMFARVISWPLR